MEEKLADKVPKEGEADDDDEMPPLIPADRRLRDTMGKAE